MKNKDRGHGLNKYLFSRGDIGFTRRVKVALDALRLSKPFQSIDDVVDFRGSNVKSEGTGMA